MTNTALYTYLCEADMYTSMAREFCYSYNLIACADPRSKYRGVVKRAWGCQGPGPVNMSEA